MMEVIPDLTFGRVDDALTGTLAVYEISPEGSGPHGLGPCQHGCAANSRRVHFVRTEFKWVWPQMETDGVLSCVSVRQRKLVSRDPSRSWVFPSERKRSPALSMHFYIVPTHKGVVAMT